MIPPQGNISNSLDFFSAVENVTGNFQMFVSITGNGVSTTESNPQSTLPKDIRILKIQVTVKANTKSNDIIFGVRDGGVTVASITVDANNGVERVTSGDLDVIIDADSEINLLRDTSDSSSGTLDYRMIVWYEAL